MRARPPLSSPSLSVSSSVCSPSPAASLLGARPRALWEMWARSQLRLEAASLGVVGAAVLWACARLGPIAEEKSEAEPERGAGSRGGGRGGEEQKGQRSETPRESRESLERRASGLTNLFALTCKVAEANGHTLTGHARGEPRTDGTDGPGAGGVHYEGRHARAPESSTAQLRARRDVKGGPRTDGTGTRKQQHRRNGSPGRSAPQAP